MFLGRRALVSVWVMITAVGVATSGADTAPTPIAVPLLGTQGQAGPYGSTLHIVARGGPSSPATFSVTLHRVTHGCADDLAVLLVHNNTDKYLLMSDAGGCSVLQGTSLTFQFAGTPLADEPAPTLVGESMTIGASNYGPQPVFPAPAPPGPYSTTLPIAVNPEGTWTLYVMDTTSADRGVIAGGWSLNYDANLFKEAPQRNVPVPANQTLGIGRADSYPMTFDFSQVPDGVLHAGVFTLAITLRHMRPDDLRLVLQSPSGTTVALMANAGGDTDLAPGTLLIFSDDAAATLTDTGPIFSGTYKPGAVFEGASGSDIPLGPPLPHASSFTAFAFQPIRGVWKLWAYDDTLFDTGEIAHALLTIGTERPADAVITTPALPFTSTQPFVHVEGQDRNLDELRSATWRVEAGGAFVDAGAFTLHPDTGRFDADVPLRKGLNTIVYRVQSTGLGPGSGSFTVNVDEFTYALAEGATGSFFDLDVTLANPALVDAPVTVDFLPEGGVPLTYTNSVKADAPLQIPVDTLVPGASLSTIVHSRDAIPLAVERTMIWDSTGYGGHGGTAVAAHTRWLFAEGSQGYFNTYILLANDNTVPADVTVKFLREGGDAVSLPITVPARSRRTIFAGDVAAIVNQSFGIDVTSTQPIIAERAMYLPGARLFEGGHESAGVNEPSRQWFLAEGATGSFFDCFVLLSNPSATPATVQLTYLLPDGSTIPQTITVPANGRQTINIETVDPALANADVSTTVMSDVPIVVERAMYWPDAGMGWREAHNSFGVTASALRWGLADGRIGGPRAYQTYVLLANPNPLPAEVRVRFLKSGAAAVERTYTLPPRSRRSIWTNSEVPELGDGVFAVDVEVLNYQPIAVEKAMYWNSGPEVFAGGTGVTATRLPPR